ncbi:MAG: hypothetical protein HDT44_06720 [Ruminococcaceae bacterium]|nr:hypothetical protein [Oscillospiraceae bacterium]
MKFISLNCPNCNAPIIVEGDRNYAHCEHCGTSFAVDDGINRTEHTVNINKNKTYRKVDEARIHENDTYERIEIEKLKYKSKKDKREIILILMMLLPIIIFFLYGLHERYVNTPNSNEVKISASAENYKGRNYQEVVNELKAAGFSNIETVAVDDLITGWITKENSISQISINGDFKFSSGKIFPKDAKVIISYHTFSSG